MIITGGKVYNEISLNMVKVNYIIWFKICEIMWNIISNIS